MSDLKEYRKEVFEMWVLNLITDNIHEYHAWDGIIEDEEDDFDEDDWEWIRNNLKVSSISIEEQ